MKIVIQRVRQASVSIGGKQVSQIGNGLLILLGVTHDDDINDVNRLAAKTAALRIFNDDNGVMNRSVLDVGGDIMVVSQFTLYASTRKGNRPSYINAAGHELAVPMYEAFCDRLESLTGKTVARGVFGADMQVALVNDGPVTIIIDSKSRT